MSKRVGIILVNWNSFEFTNQCILSLKKCNHEIFDIIVVDNGSNDLSNHELKNSHSDVVLIQSETNTGFAGGNNLGINYALKRDYTYIMLLNNDTFVEENFLTVLVDYMDQNSDVGIIQPKIFCNHNRKLLWNGGSYYYNWITLPYTKGYLKPASQEFNSIKEVDWVTGCAFFTRSSILKEVGTLEEKFFIYFEDVDLSFRIKEQGYKLIYHPFSIIYHIAGMSNKSKVKQKEGYVNSIVHYLNQRNRIWFIKRYVKWYSLLPTFFYNFFYTAAIMSYFVIFKRFKKLKAVYDGSKDGFLKSI